MRYLPLRYAIYTRQSTAVAAGEEFSSCDAQFAMCRDFMRCYGDGAIWIGERLDDIGETGSNTKRPALERLLTLVAEQRIDHVVIYRLDRLTRSLLDSVELFEKLRTNNVKLFIVTAPEIGTAATDRLVLNLMSSFAEFEREMIASRIAETRAYLRQHGRRLAGKLPYGYDADPYTKQLVVNSEEASNVEEMFRMAAEGMLSRDIAAAANSRGWRTKCTVTRRTARESGGGLWTPRQVLTLLSNAVYLGRFCHEGGTRPGTHPAIISEDLFEQTRRQVAARRKLGKKAKTPVKRHLLFWSLRGKVLCPDCGRAMSTHITQKGNIWFPHYRCRSFAGGRPPCKGSAFRAYDLERMVSDLIGKMEFCESTSDSANIDRDTFRRFQEKWKSLGEIARNRHLPKIVTKILFDRKSSTIRVETNGAGMTAVANGKEDDATASPGAPIR